MSHLLHIDVDGLLGWLFDDSLHQILLAVAVLEIAFIQLQIFWLLAHAIRRRVAKHQGAALTQELGTWLGEILRDSDLRADWVKRARRYPRPVLRAHLAPLLAMTNGHARVSLERLYRAAGLLAEDIPLSRSRLWGRRMLGLRRLSLVASAQEVPILLERSGDRYAVQVLCARILTRVATPGQLLTFIRQVTVPKRIMEQPLAAALSTASVAQMELLVSCLATINDQHVRRLVLVSAARIAPEKCLKVLLDLPQQLDKEARITSCVAAEWLPTKDLAPLILRGLKDPAFEVRAQAARSCARLFMPDLLIPLGQALEDPVFWVRQNAAQALTAQGPAGERRLVHIAEAGRDRFAVNTARQELQRTGWRRGEASAP